MNDLIGPHYFGFLINNDCVVQVAIIYCGVRGHLDKLDPAKITAFEKEFTQHIKTSHQTLLANIAKDGQITPESDAALKKLVVDFIATFAAQ